MHGVVNSIAGCRAESPPRPATDLETRRTPCEGGPNATTVNPTGADLKLKTALAIAAGRSFSYGGVSLPLNLVLFTSPHGQRLGFIIGYAIQRVG